MADVSVLESNPISNPEKPAPNLRIRNNRERWKHGETTKSNSTLWHAIWRKISNPEPASGAKKVSKKELDKRRRSQARREDKKTISRREFLKWGTVGAVGLGLTAYGGGWLNLAGEKELKKNQSLPTNTRLPQVAEAKRSPVPEKVVTPEDLLNEILALPLKSPERDKKETEYINKIKQSPNLELDAKLKLIDRGFWAVSEINQRAMLLDLRYQIREKENSSLIKLSNEQLRWISEKQIHPEVLGLCLDTEKKARDIITRLISLDGGKIDKFRPDLVRLQEFNHPKAVSLGSVMISDMMINPGGMARLVCYETGLARGKEDAEGFLFNNFVYGFSFIGGKQAVTEINPEAFPTAIPALRELCELLKINTGLNFIPENIPGSEWRDKHINISGGAIGLQFMPSKALEIYYLLEKVDYKFNPFDLESALIGAWVFLARGELIGNNEVRFGYLKGHADKIKGAIAKWNPLADQINKIYNAAVDYYNKIIEPPLIQAAKH